MDMNTRGGLLDRPRQQAQQPPMPQPPKPREKKPFDNELMPKQDAAFEVFKELKKRQQDAIIGVAGVMLVLILYVFNKTWGQMAALVVVVYYLLQVYLTRKNINYLQQKYTLS